MVVKTNTCVFSDQKVFPGKGISQIRRDGRQMLFASSKCKSLFNQQKKAAKIVWTRNWRVLHKKIKVQREARKIKKTKKKTQRAIQGLDLEAIATRKTEAFRSTLRAKKKGGKKNKNQKEKDAADRSLFVTNFLRKG